MGIGQALMTVWFAAGAPAASPALEAERLFDQGRDLLAQKRTPEACTAFEGSYRLDPALGTLLNRATCYLALGKQAAAWADFRDAAVWAHRTGEPKREEFAKSQAALLEPKLAHLNVFASNGIQVTLDGNGVSVPPGGQEFTVDPGRHTIGATAEGKIPWETTIAAPVVGPPIDVQVPALLPIPPANVPVSEPAVAPPPVAALEVAKPARSPGSRLLGIGVAAGAVVLGALGTAGIVYSWNTDHAALAQAPGGADFHHPTVTASQWQQLGWIYPCSIASLAVGVAATGLGVYFAVQPPLAGAGGTVNVGGTL